MALKWGLSSITVIGLNGQISELVQRHLTAIRELETFDWSISATSHLRKKGFFRAYDYERQQYLVQKISKLAFE